MDIVDLTCPIVSVSIDASDDANVNVWNRSHTHSQTSTLMPRLGVNIPLIKFFLSKQYFYSLFKFLSDNATEDRQ